MNRKKPDAEELVKRCFLENRNKIVRFVHASKSGALDAQGIDFKVWHKDFNFYIDLQVKTSDSEKSLGLVLPLPRRLPDRLRGQFSDWVVISIVNHARKHPKVVCLLFVGKPGRSKRQEVILQDILKEVELIFEVVKRERQN